MHKILIICFCLVVSGLWAVDIPSANNGVSSNNVVRVYYSGTQNLEKEIPLVNGKKTGLAKYYYKNGIVREEILWDKDVQCTQRQYYDNGKLQRETQYRHGKRNGYQRSYFVCGHLNREVWFKDDLLHGTLRDFNDLGMVVYKAKFRNGERYFEKKF